MGTPRTAGYIYAYRPVGSSRMKIGWSGKDPWGSDGRLKSMSVLIDAFDIPIERVLSQFHEHAGPIEREHLKKVLTPLRVTHTNGSKLTEIFHGDPVFLKKVLTSALQGDRSQDEWKAWHDEWAKEVGRVAQRLLKEAKPHS